MSSAIAKGKSRQNISRYSLVIEMVVIFIALQILTQGMFFTNVNINNLLLQSVTYAIMGCSMVYVMIIGGIDLAAGAMLGFLCTLSATLQVSYKMDTAATMAITLLAGLFFGCWNGFWIAYRKMPAFIVTLAGQNIFKGLTLLVGGGVSVGPVSEGFAKYGKGFLSFGGDDTRAQAGWFFLIAILLLTAAMVMRNRKARKKYGFDMAPLYQDVLKIVGIAAVTLAVGSILLTYKGLPNALVILVILAAAATYIGRNTPFGRAIYAIGNNAEAARLSGINNKRVTFNVYAMHGLVVSLASIVYIGRIGQASSTTGTGFEFSAITGCILGGTSTLGGKGTVVGAIIGMVIMASLDNGMSLLNLRTTYQYLIKGFVLIAAVCLDIMSKKEKA